MQSLYHCQQSSSQHATRSSRQVGESSPSSSGQQTVTQGVSVPSAKQAGGSSLQMSSSSGKQFTACASNSKTSSAPVCTDELVPALTLKPSEQTVSASAQEECIILRMENDSLKKHIMSLETKITQMANSLSILTNELSELRTQQAPQSLSPQLPSSDVNTELQPNIIQAIENCITRIVPTLISRHLMHVSLTSS
jgi:hypothetical protein